MVKTSVCILTIKQHSIEQVHGVLVTTLLGIVFGVDNSSSSRADNRKNKILLLGEGPANDINGSFGAAEQKFSINFSQVLIVLLTFSRSSANIVNAPDHRNCISLNKQQSMTQPTFINVRLKIYMIHFQIV